jgi:hypothetical protein
MSNFNMSAIKRIVNELGLECQLIPSSSQPKTCLKVIINGRELKASNWTKAEAESILISIKEEGCKKSAIDNMFNTENTGSNLKELIHFESNTLTNCLEEFRKITESSKQNKVNTWVNTMTDFFTNEISGKTDTQACANKIKNMIDTKQIRVINNFIYSSFELTNVIKTWQELNNINLNINYNMAIDKYINAVESL